MVVMAEDIDRFVASLAIPEHRKLVVRAELLDHAECAREAARQSGGDPEAAARDALGNLEAMRRALEAIEPAFHMSRWHAFARALAASVMIAFVIDRGGAMAGIAGMVATLAIAIACAPSRGLDMLRGELRAPRVRGTLGRGVAIGPALTYAFTVLAGPIIVWIALIVVRALDEVTPFDVPPSAFTLCVGVYALLFVEGLRARRAAVA